VRLEVHRLVRAWNQQLGPGTRGGRWCVRRTSWVDRPYRLDLRRPSVGLDVQQLILCAVHRPPHAAGAPGTTGVFVPWLAPRIQFWQRSWRDVYAFATGNLPMDVRQLTSAHVKALVTRIDTVFWDGTVLRTVARRGWTCMTSAVDDGFGDRLGARSSRSVFPVASVAVYRDRKLMHMRVETHPGYWPAYPHVGDGVRVHNRREHLCHVVAHEIVHMVRVLFHDDGRGMYNTRFRALNLWVYGHTADLDSDAPDAPAPVVVD